MKFDKKDSYHAVSPCRRYTINVGGAGKGRRCYMAVFNGRKILGVWHCDDEPGDRAAAYNEAVQACMEHAAEASQ